MEESVRRVGFYGRRKGRRLSQTQQDLSTTLLPSLVPQDWPELIEKARSLKKEIILEIGFGSGDHLTTLAENSPDSLFIGGEVFLNGITRCLKKIQDKSLTNIYLWPQDIRLLWPLLPKECLDKVFILFPDPWPKERHHKRRLLSADFFATLDSFMTQGASLHLASDHPSYLEWIETHLAAYLKKNPTWKWVEGFPTHTHPISWPYTRYEEKAQKLGSRCTYMSLAKAT